MTKAEKAGLKAYPENISYSTIIDVMYDYNAENRRIYVAGYEQGYKDAVDKACEWLEKQENSPILSNSAKTGKNWGEEDEIGSDATIELLEYFINYAPEFRKPTIRRSIDWLKSLKKRMEE